MLEFFTRKPTPPLVDWSHAPALRAAGYCALPIEKYAVETGYGGGEQPLSGGWAHGLGEPSNPDTTVLGVLCGRLPLLYHGGHATVPLDEARATWICAVRIEVISNARVARELESVVRKFAGADAPVRECAGSPSLLIPFAAQCYDPRDFGQSSKGVMLPGDKKYSGTNVVTVASAGTCFVAGGGKWSWRDGRDLLTVPRSELPVLTPGKARELIDECNGLLNAKAAA
jgi:hypothetical protein